MIASIRERTRSQTPFGFWYVLDGDSVEWKQVQEEDLSQTPFGFWYVLDELTHKAILAAVTAGHKRLSAFGMSWTGRDFNAEANAMSEGHKRLSAFGMSWTHSNRKSITPSSLRVTNAFRLLVCLGHSVEWKQISPDDLDVTNAFRLLVCLGLVAAQKIARACVAVTNAFRLLVCLGPPKHIGYIVNREWFSHKRLSAFGMSWTP